MSVPARFLHVSFKWGETDKDAVVHEVLKTALDWAKYAPHCWILWSTREVEEWLKYLRPHLGTKDNVFIWQVDLSNAGATYTGMAEKWFWDWIRKPR